MKSCPSPQSSTRKTGMSNSDRKQAALSFTPPTESPTLVQLSNPLNK